MVTSEQKEMESRELQIQAELEESGLRV